MTREAFRELVKKGPVLLDGATGTNLQKAGMPVGVCPEQWILENSEVLIDLQKRYVEAGTDILFAPTFTASRIKLKEYGLEDHLEEMNRKLVALSKEAAKGTNALVAGDLTMTGEQLYPLGDLMFEDLVDVYKEQAKIIAEAGADLFVVETMMSLQECRAAVLAIREVCDLPVMVSLTYNEDGRTLYGTDPVTAVVVMQSLGADAVGMNCSTGPEAMLEPIAKMAEYAAIPLLAKPNAGMPELIDGQTVFNVEPEEFAEVGKKLVEEGAAIIGGCCGTTPEHIRALKEAVKGIPVKAPLQTKRRMLTSERKSVEITLDGRFMVIGERINPTGKKKLQAELKEGSLNLVRTMALEQEENGASILDINMGMNGIDEKEMMLKCVNELTLVSNLPLSIDSSHPSVVEAALRIYPGRALINSISLEPEKFEKLIPVARKYGAMFILLPLSEVGLPKDIDEKKEIIHTILERAYEFGLTKEDVVVDGLVATIGANRNAAKETMETISYCKNDIGVATACGLSNISFGLPERMFVNSSFMSIAISHGLTMAIANPSQDLLMHSMFAADLLMNKPESDTRYINRVTGRKLSVLSGDIDASQVKVSGGTAASATDIDSNVPKDDKLFEAVVKGRSKKIEELVKEALENGAVAQDIIDKSLIPAITHVGKLFDKQIYYLPQLISSAETMELGIGVLEPVLAQNKDKEPLGTIVMATVEHDIHDIGKNLVVLMLKNYGYDVIDLGKDVPAETIIEAAKEHNADIIGLSALMTTTMMEMKKVVNLVKENNMDTLVIIGGAVITQGFADEIGADGYSEDAQNAVEVVGKLLAERGKA